MKIHKYRVEIPRLIGLAMRVSLIMSLLYEPQRSCHSAIISAFAVKLLQILGENTSVDSAMKDSARDTHVGIIKSDFLRVTGGQWFSFES